MSRHFFENFLREKAFNTTLQVELELFKRKYKNIDPVIAIQFYTMMILVTKDKNDLLYGSRQKKTIERIEEVLQRFKDLNIKMVFFVEGCVTHENMQDVTKSCYIREINHLKFYEDIRNTSKIDDLDNVKHKFKCNIHNLLQLIPKFGKMKFCFENTVYREMADFAKNEKAIAIITNSSQCIFMPGELRIWSLCYASGNFDIQRFPLRVTVRRSIRDYLRLNDNQMPLFGAFVGILDYAGHLCWDDVQNILGMFQGSESEYVNLAKYIKYYFPRGVPLDSRELETLANLVVDGNDGSINLFLARRAISNSIQFFTVFKPEFIEEVLIQHIEITSSPIIYIILKNFPFHINQYWIDTDLENVKLFSTLIIPILRRKMGIILFDKKWQTPKRTIYFKRSNAENYHRQMFEPIYPEKNLGALSLDQLLQFSFEKDDNLKSKKFELLSWILFPENNQIDSNALRHISGSLLFIPTIFCCFLVKNEQISIEEADCFLVAYSEAINLSVENLDDIIKPTSINPRAFWITNVWIGSLQYIRDAMVICGLFKLIHLLQFDGYIFHNMYANYFDLDMEEKTALELKISDYRLYVS